MIGGRPRGTAGAAGGPVLIQNPLIGPWFETVGNTKCCVNGELKNICCAVVLMCGGQLLCPEPPHTGLVVFVWGVPLVPLHPAGLKAQSGGKMPATGFWYQWYKSYTSIPRAIGPASRPRANLAVAAVLRGAPAFGRSVELFLSPAGRIAVESPAMSLCGRKPDNRHPQAGSWSREQCRDEVICRTNQEVMQQSYSPSFLSREPKGLGFCCITLPPAGGPKLRSGRGPAGPGAARPRPSDAYDLRSYVGEQVP